MGINFSTLHPWQGDTSLCDPTQTSASSNGNQSISENSPGITQSEKNTECDETEKIEKETSESLENVSNKTTEIKLVDEKILLITEEQIKQEQNIPEKDSGDEVSINKDIEEPQNDGEEGNHIHNKRKLELFKKEMAIKKEARQKAIQALSNKLEHLQKVADEATQARIVAEKEVSNLKEKYLSEDLLKQLLDEEKVKVINLEEKLKEETEIRQDLEKRLDEELEKDQRIHAMKEVIKIGKEMLKIRELQVKELKKKLIEGATCPSDIKEEYELQIQNVKKLKRLYEERAEAVKVEHNRAIEREIARIKVLETKIGELERERREYEVMREHLKERVTKLDKELEDKNDDAMNLQEQLDASVVECKELGAQMKLINDIFSKILVGNLNLDTLTKLVEENQDLVNDLTTGDKTNDELAALLIEIAKQLDEENTAPIDIVAKEQESNVITGLPTEQVTTMSQKDIALNLSKVWRILVHLMHDYDNTSKYSTSLPNQNPESSSENCYKSIETSTGKRSVISVSKTFLTLKDLILEKNSLIKEVSKLKSLNEHLETRLNCQENRLSIVSSELKKTWGVVSKLRAQHKQLHTQEKILKYELQHKRLLLNDLKDELERCKAKWDTAREKNCQSEEDWRRLRKEFAERRKNRSLINNSTESGYDEEDESTPTTTQSSPPAEEDNSIEEEYVPLSIEEDFEVAVDMERESVDIPFSDELTMITESTNSVNDTNENNFNVQKQNDKCDITDNIDEISSEQNTEEEKYTNIKENDQKLYSQNQHEQKMEDIHPIIKNKNKERINENTRGNKKEYYNDNNSESKIEDNRDPKKLELPSTSRTDDENNASRQAEAICHENEFVNKKKNIKENHEIETNKNREEITEKCTDVKSGNSNPNVTKIIKSVTFKIDDNQSTSNTAENISKFLSPLIIDDDNSSFCDNNDNVTETSLELELKKDILNLKEVPADPPLLENEDSEELNSDTFNQSIESSLINENKNTVDNNHDDEENKFDEACGFSDGYNWNLHHDETAQLSNKMVKSKENLQNSVIIDSATSNSLTVKNSQNQFETVSSETNNISNTASSLSSATSSLSQQPEVTLEQVLDARTLRLQRLEEQCKSLFNKVTATTIKSNVLSTKLELLHEQYGGNNSANSDNDRTEENDENIVLKTKKTTSTNENNNGSGK